MGSVRKILKENFAFVLIFIAAAFLRLYNLDKTFMFLGDQGRDAIVIKRIISFEHFPAIGPTSSVGGAFLGPFYYYLMAPFLFIFNLNPFGLAFGVSILSLFGILISYLIIKKIIGKGTAIFFSILVSFSAVNINFSRFSWNPNLLPLFSFLSLYFLYCGIFSKRKKLCMVLFGSFLGFSLQLHYLALTLLVTAIVFLLATFFLWREKLGYKNVALSFSGLFVSLLPLVLFDLKNRFINIKSLFKIFTNQSTKVVGKPSYAIRVLNTNGVFWSDFFQAHLSRTISFIILIILLSAVITLMRRSNKSNKKNAFVFLNILNIIVFVLLFAVFFVVRHPHYYLLIYYSVFLLIAVVFDELLKLNRYFGLVIIVIFLSLYIYLNSLVFAVNLKPRKESPVARSRKIALSVLPNVDKKVFQLVPLPYTATDSDVRYFLEVYGKRPLSFDSPQEADEIFVLCYQPKCQVLGNKQWQIAAFHNPKVVKIWKVEDVVVYKVVHGKK